MNESVLKYTGGPVMCNGYLLKGPNGYVAVDAPAGFADWVQHQLPEGAVLTDLLLTHQHFDHVQDAAALQQQTGCQLHAHSAYSPQLTLEEVATRSWGLPLTVQPFAVNDCMSDQVREANWGGLTWRVYAIPGHSPDSLVYECPEAQALLTGDVLFAGSVGRTDFPGGCFNSLINGIRTKLATLDGTLTVYSGHGPNSCLQEEFINNPYLT